MSDTESEEFSSHEATFSDQINDTNPASQRRRMLTVKRMKLEEMKQKENRQLSISFLNAAKRARKCTLLLLLEKGADVNCRNNDGYTPLMLAARTGVRRVVKLSLKAGANVNDVNWNGDTALVCAVRKGCDNCANELIARGADVNIINCEGNTALLYAAEVADEKSLELLIKSGADVNIRGR